MMKTNKRSCTDPVALIFTIFPRQKKDRQDICGILKEQKNKSILFAAIWTKVDRKIDRQASVKNRTKHRTKLWMGKRHRPYSQVSREWGRTGPNRFPLSWSPPPSLSLTIQFRRIRDLGISDAKKVEFKSFACVVLVVVVVACMKNRAGQQRQQQDIICKIQPSVRRTNIRRCFGVAGREGPPWSDHLGTTAHAGALQKLLYKELLLLLFLDTINSCFEASVTHLTAY